MTRRTQLAPPTPDYELQQLVHDIDAAKATVQRLRPLLHARIYDYWKAYGARRGWQTELVKVTGLTRERIRQILDAEDERRDTEQSPHAAA